MSRYHRSTCPLNIAVEILGDRWSLLILRDMMFSDRRGFNDLHSGNAEGISPRVLSERLRHLVNADLVRVQVDHSDRRRAIYALSEAAIQLVPVIVHLASWALRRRPVPPEQWARFAALGQPAMRSAFMDELRAMHIRRLRMVGYRQLEVRPSGQVMLELKAAHDAARR